MDPTGSAEKSVALAIIEVTNRAVALSVSSSKNKAQSIPEHAATDPASDRLVPLVLDLDRTLLRTDTLHEQGLEFIKQNPMNLFRIVFWLRRGRAYLKQKIGEAIDLPIADLPVNANVVSLAKEAEEHGRAVVIATAADKKIAENVAARLDVEATLLASDGVINLKGSAKATALAKRFPDGFDYAGDSHADLAVWKVARKAILVEPSSSVKRAAMRLGNVSQVFSKPSILRALVRAARPHQWLKNSLIVVPAILSGLIFEPVTWPILALTFISLGVIASATYILNDIWDLHDDRAHWSKCNRPLASGDLPISIGIIAILAGLAGGFLIAASVGFTVMGAIAIYLALTLAYSIRLKRIVVQDAIALASLFTIRLAIGTVAVGAVPSPWLFVFSMFFFLSLAFAKRHTEIARLIEKGGDQVAGRGYYARDLPLVLSAGISTGVASVLIMVLYISEDAFQLSFSGDVLWLWGFPPIIFALISRIWTVCQRGQLHDDPVVFAVTDRQCQMFVGMLGICFVMAWFGFPFG